MKNYCWNCKLGIWLALLIPVFLLIQVVQDIRDYWMIKGIVIRQRRIESYPKEP